MPSRENGRADIQVQSLFSVTAALASLKKVPSSILGIWGFQVQGKSELKIPDRWCGRKKLAEQRRQVCVPFRYVRTRPQLNTQQSPPDHGCAVPRREAWPLSSNLKKNYFLFLAVLGFCCFAQAVSSCGEQRAYCLGFSCCEAQALSVQASVVAECGPSSCGSWAH